ncbi:11356_t:CDS:2, partial [Entrophospora sp. SA101]
KVGLQHPDLLPPPKLTYFGTLNDDMEEGDRHTKGLLEQSDQDLTNIFQYHYHNLNQPILKI